MFGPPMVEGIQVRSSQLKVGSGERIFLHCPQRILATRSEEHTSELQSLVRISYAVLCSKKRRGRHAQSISPSNLSTRIAKAIFSCQIISKKKTMTPTFHTPLFSKAL